MDLDRLQSVRDSERQTDKLQQLSEDFYAEAAELIEELRAERDRRAAASENPFGDDRVNRLNNRINTAQRTVEAIYEKRVGKVVKAASFRAADLPAEASGMTAEEQDLFERLVSEIKANRQRVLATLAGEAGDQDGPRDEQSDHKTQRGSYPPDSEETGSDEGADGDGSNAAGIPAADLMSGDTGETREIPPPPAEPIDDEESAGEGTDSRDATGGSASGSHGEQSGDQPTESDHPSDNPDARGGTGTGSENAAETVESVGSGTEFPRKTVRITEDVGDIFGVDQREYDLAVDDVVTLPEANADPLLEQDAADRLE